MTKVAVLLIVLALLFVGYVAAPAHVGAQGCGCTMEATLGTEPAPPTATAFATLYPPPLPDKPVRPPTANNAVYLPIVGGAG